jgi:hypothetical protein
MLAIAAAAGVGSAWGYRNPGVRWTAVGAALAGVALLAGIVGVPIALAGLFNLRDELERLNAASDARTTVRRHAAAGMRIDAAWRQNPNGAAFNKWRDETEVALGELTDETGQLGFRLAGDGRAPIDELKAKCDYLMNYLLPGL